MTRYDYAAEYLVPVVGMPKRLADGVAVLSALWPEDDGPAHIVIADWNTDEPSIQWCIDQIGRGETYSDYPAGHPIFAATRAVLQWILENTTQDERTSWEVTDAA